jgi:hypothetical protein
MRRIEYWHLYSEVRCCPVGNGEDLAAVAGTSGISFNKIQNDDSEMNVFKKEMVPWPARKPHAACRISQGHGETPPYLSEAVLR